MTNKLSFVNWYLLSCMCAVIIIAIVGLIISYCLTEIGVLGTIVILCLIAGLGLVLVSYLDHLCPLNKWR